MTAEHDHAFDAADPAPAAPEDWHAWIADAGLPVIEPLSATKLLVVSAHPDDEVLGAAGLMSAVRRGGGTVTVVCLSDGAASHPLSPTVTADQMADLRQAELRRALHLLGVDHISHARLPDGRLSDHHREIAEAIARADAQHGPHDVIATLWPDDRHPDHAAVGQVSRSVARRSGAMLLEYPIWMWRWARPGDPAVPWHRAGHLPLPVADRERKLSAVGHFVSQIHPLSDADRDAAVLTADFLDRVTGPAELYFR